MLQKNRELKAAGIEVRYKPKIKGADYSKEIPFEHEVPEGRYTPDHTETPATDQFKQGISLQ